jgi:alpha/beta superfamily hydrolase
LVVGFSFGAYVALRACCRDADALPSGVRVPGFAALGLPVAAEGRNYHYGFLAGCTMTKLFISGGADQYGPTAILQQIVASAAEPKSLVIIPGTDHFFAGKLDQMQQALGAWLVANFFPELRGSDLQTT